MFNMELLSPEGIRQGVASAAKGCNTSKLVRITPSSLRNSLTFLPLASLRNIRLP